MNRQSYFSLAAFADLAESNGLHCVLVSFHDDTMIVTHEAPMQIADVIAALKRAVGHLENSSKDEGNEKATTSPSPDA